VEAQNFSVRKHLLEYDDVMNKQRESVYTLRRELLDGKIQYTEDDVLGTREYLMALAEDLLDATTETYCGREMDVEQWDLEALKLEATRLFTLEATDYAAIDFGDKSADEIRDALWSRIVGKYEQKEQLVGREILGRIERDFMLQIVDAQWKDHLYSLDHLKEGIGLRGYGQRDPLVEYKKESFDLFQDMKARIDEEIVRYLWSIRPVSSEERASSARPVAARPAQRPRAPLVLSGGEEGVPAFVGARSGGSGGATSTAVSRTPARVGGDDADVRTVRREEPKVGRNDPCPCGSGKKYKKCHGAA
jgi:preprotein translocase subunit SecA